MSERPETGAMKFADDWTGVFIRGDDALYYAIALRQYLEAPRDGDVITAHIVRGLMQILFSCNEGPRTPGDQLDVFMAAIQPNKDQIFQQLSAWLAGCQPV